MEKGEEGKMGLTRKPFQGVFNIIRFNWHFYVLSVVLLVALLATAHQFHKTWQPLIYGIASLATATLVMSLLASFYTYDLSRLYQFDWLGKITVTDQVKIINMNAGFDETSMILKSKLKGAEIIMCDFYDSAKHTEVSIKRARKAYPPDPATISVKTAYLPFADSAVDMTFVILAAHEIRDDDERVNFFRELNRVTKADGQIFVTEHLRDWRNFLAYNMGFFHFYSRSTWLRTFVQANLTVKREIKTTPFITTFVLKKHGSTR